MELTREQAIEFIEIYENSNNEDLKVIVTQETLDSFNIKNDYKCIQIIEGNLFPFGQIISISLRESESMFFKSKHYETLSQLDNISPC